MLGLLLRSLPFSFEQGNSIRPSASKASRWHVLLDLSFENQGVSKWAKYFPLFILEIPCEGISQTNEQ
jgi:hypothetical protein